MKKYKHLAAAVALPLLAILGAINTTAQNTAMSPYTRYGYGQLSDNASSMQRQMGGVGYAMNSGRQINVMNPASYAAMDSLTFLFDMGVDFTVLQSREGDTGETQYGGGLDYITMQIPIVRGLGASIGLLPYGSVGYSFGNSITNGAIARNGSGSINQLYLGIGGSPLRGLGIGVNVAYLFGSTENALYATTDGGSTSVFQRTMRVRDWRMDIGLQYSLRIGKKDIITAGLTYAPKKDLHGDVYGIYYDTSISNAIPDTVNIGDTKMNGRYSTPESWGAGLSWRRNGLLVEGDFTFQPWSKAKFGTIENFEESKFADRYRGAIGAEFHPSARGGYFRNIRYRIGASYTRDYIMIRDNHVRDFALTCGFGLPVPGFKTLVNLGLEYRHRQATPNALIKENYFNITLGINFNEMWFQKSKIY